MDLSSFSALYLEDDPLIALDISFALKQFGFGKVETTFDVAAAELALANETFDIAVLDINLQGGETSYGLGRRLLYEGQKVIFITGNGFREDELKAEGYGFIAKPVRQNKLFEEILSILELK